MRNLGYSMVKIWMKINLHLYFGIIEKHGLYNVPKNQPVLFLPNHQNALLDVLLIAVDCNRKPWFLTRSDVFKSKTLKTIFGFFQMIPIYRIRDGRESLKNNQAVFDRCTELLLKKEALLMFPEANHNLKRRVRPLSKGFTRILFNTLNQNDTIDIQIVPIGINYNNATLFPDRVSLYFDTPISVRELYDETDVKSSIDRIKDVVSNQLKTVTTHIEDEENYDIKLAQLHAQNADFLNPIETNLKLQQLHSEQVELPAKSAALFSKIFRLVFNVLNFPVLLLWKYYFKPKVWEAEFMGTLRFAFSLISFPIYYICFFVILSIVVGNTIAIGGTLSLFLFNTTFVKIYKA